MAEVNHDSPFRTIDGRFIKGCPGGPGRPRRAVRAAASAAIDERLAHAAGALIEVALKQANDGNLAAVKMLLNRVWSGDRALPLDITLQRSGTSRDLLAVQTVVTDAVLAGAVSSAEGAKLTRLLQDHLALLDKTQVEEHLEQRERRIAARLAKPDQ